MRKRMRWAVPVMAASLLVGCGQSAISLTDGIKPVQVNTEREDSGENEKSAEAKTAVLDFSVRLLQESEKKGENTLVSPVSVLCALGMTGVGSEGNTRAQMEDAFGTDVDALNAFMGDYVKSLPNGKNYKMHVADSIWLNQSKNLQIEDAYLQTVVSHYDAEIMELAFDGKAEKEINGWVKDNTDEMIPKIIDQINDNAVAYLVNAVAFDAKWADPYESGQVFSGTFTMENGETQEVEMMSSGEYHYIQGDNETGFAKYYENDGEKDTYAFVALLPEEGVSMSKYVASLSGEEVQKLLENEEDCAVVTQLPKFEVDYDASLNQVLLNMGMTDAFDSQLADFTGMGTCTDGNIYIGEVLHKTYMKVDAEGTRAGAATAVVMECGSTMPEQEVLLNRPFVYMIVDCENQIPIFLGIMNDCE